MSEVLDTGKSRPESVRNHPAQNGLLYHEKKQMTMAPSEILAQTAEDWRENAIRSMKQGRPEEHLKKLEKLRSVCIPAILHEEAIENGHATHSGLIRVEDCAWITVATAAELATQWHHVTKLVVNADNNILASTTFPPLFGVPIAVKDNIDVKGFPTTAACPGFSYSPEHSATVVQHLQEAGALVIGKTNMDQFATGLVGIRSPYGFPRNTLSPSRISGGSSSGSAVVVAHGLVPLALGTDTAGSGRVPAAFNNIIGVKPSKGLISTNGVVPACRTLDCISIFALTMADAQLALSVCAKYDQQDPYSRQPGWIPNGCISSPESTKANTLKVAVPKNPIFFSPPSTPEGADLYRNHFMMVCANIPKTWVGAEVEAVDFSPLHDLAALLYNGPWVAERWAAIREYVKRTNGKDLDPTVLKIVCEGSMKFDAADVFAFEYKAADLRRKINLIFNRYDVMVVPTTPMPAPTPADVAADPVHLNANLGTYTNFVNLADWCGLSLPAGFCSPQVPAKCDDPLAFGVTLLAPAWNDWKLLMLGSAWLSALDHGRYRLGATSRVASPAMHIPRHVSIVPEGYVHLAVVGAHLRGMPKHYELEQAGAIFLYMTQTAKCYRLFALTDMSKRPGLVRVWPGSKGWPGAAVEIEVYALPEAGFGHFVAGVSPPLAIGAVECADGAWVRGFVCEPRAVSASSGATDVTSFRGWKHYIRFLQNPPQFHTVLVANRGEIAVRAIRTLQKLGIRAIAIYAEADKYAQHVDDADEAILLESEETHEVGGSSLHQNRSVASDTYLNIQKVIGAAKQSGAEAIFPGYGFLSENPKFAAACADEGISFIGPLPEHIMAFALKHTARAIALQANVPIVPGTELLSDADSAVAAAQTLGFPVMLKSTAGGGGIGMQMCDNVQDLLAAYDRVVGLGERYFSDGNVFLEKYIQRMRHVEIQVIADAHNHIIALGDRDCSLQRRHQKVVEEAPAPNLSSETRQRMAECAVNLLRSVKYQGAGTVEFVYDIDTSEFYFLEVNTRLQVEHGVTEETFGIDLVEWMVRIAAGENMSPEFTKLSQKSPVGHAIEVRVYAEDPGNKFAPSTGELITVQLPDGLPGVRVDGWIRPLTQITSHFDPLLAKLIVHGTTRQEALANMLHALDHTQIEGICTNLAYLRYIIASDLFTQFQINTQTLDHLEFTCSGFEVIAAGTATSVQDYPGRMGYWDVGVPPSGPMDAYAFRLANYLVGNRDGAPALECTLQGPTMKFFSSAIVAITGAPAKVTVDGSTTVPMWTTIHIKPGQTLAIQIPINGCRTYVAIRGSMHIAQAMGSCSTFSLAGTGGYRGRTLHNRDIIQFEPSNKYILREHWLQSLDTRLIPNYAPLSEGTSKVWHIGAMLGPHAAPDYLTQPSLNEFLQTEWRVSHNANRLGIRLIGPMPQWTRSDGGEAGLHPSNILDCCYAIGSINFTGDTPTILTVDGPSLGGFVCPVTIVKAEMWKVGQLKPGDYVRIHLITYEDAVQLQMCHDKVAQSGHCPNNEPLFADEMFQNTLVKIDPSNASPILIHKQASEDHPKALYRAAGDGAILLEYGENKIDLVLRFRVHALMESIRASCDINGITEMVPGVCSLQIQFDAKRIHQKDLVKKLVQLEDSLGDINRMRVPSRIIRLPLAFQDQSTIQAIKQYTQTIRSQAPWLPDNVEFLQRINGLNSKKAVWDIVYSASYLILGLGDVYYGAPCAIPIDPRHRLLSSKYNPARTYTPEGAVGIGGVFMCIYGINSPGGYQLIGRTLPIWNHALAAHRSTSDSARGVVGEQCPWMLEFFDQVQFYPVTNEEITKLREDYRHGRLSLEVEYTYFDLGVYQDMLANDAEEIGKFQEIQAKAFQEEVHKWTEDTISSAQSLTANSASVPNGFSTKIPDGLHIPVMFASRTWKVFVQAGDKVEHGQTLITVEAMKTELPVIAPRDGVVKAVLCEEGQLLEASDVVVVLEE